MNLRHRQVVAADDSDGEKPETEGKKEAANGTAPEQSALR